MDLSITDLILVDSVVSVVRVEMLSVLTAVPLLELVLLVVLCVMTSSIQTSSLKSQHKSGLSPILANYHSYIIDQWGVLHNGKELYPQVLECLREMKSQGKTLIMLSNSSKRKSASQKGLLKVGIGEEIFDDIVTSGELGWKAIKSRNLDIFNGKSAADTLKVAVIGNGEDDQEYIESCNCELSPIATADFVLARGMFAIDQGSAGKICFSTAEELMEGVGVVLSEASQRNLPMLVTNPDLNRPGNNAPMPGRLGRMYRQISKAPISYIGKPHDLVYAACLEAIASKIGEITDSLMNGICCVGDSLDHDIIGAHNSNLDSIWIANGVHAGELGTTEGEPRMPSDDAIEKLFKSLSLPSPPTYTVAAFKL